MYNLTTSTRTGSSAVGNDDADDSKQSEKGIKVGDILSSKDALHLFMMHLGKEYSMECLLSLIEITIYGLFKGITWL